MINLLFIVWLSVPCNEVIKQDFNHAEVVAFINKPDVECIIESYLCYEDILQPFTTIHAPESNNVSSGATDTNYKMHFKCME